MRVKSIISFPFKYGLMETLRRIVRGRSCVPTRITDLYFRRLGGVGPRRVAKLVETSHCKKVEIVLTHGLGGGAYMYLDGQIRRATASGCIVFSLKPDSRFCGVVGVDVFSGEAKSSFLVRSLSDFNVLCGMDCAITVNELVWWHWYDKSRVVSVSSLTHLVNAILKLKETLNAKMTYLVHDYYCLCPRFTLVASDGYYCASEQTMQRCRACLACHDEASMPFELGMDVSHWRECFDRLFLQCCEVRTFSEDTKARISSCFKGVLPTVVPHALSCDFKRKYPISNEGCVIGVFGYIQTLKGSRVVVALAKYLEQLGRNDVKIKIVGDICGVSTTLPSNIKVCGKYKVEDLPDIIKEEGINIGFMSSIWPETFSYVTHELMSLGLPLVCFDIGAPRDAVSQYDKGAVILEMTVESAWKTILQLYKRIYGETD